jgi:hypothetical protein
MPTPPPPHAPTEALERLTAEIAQIGYVLPGSIVERYNRCGKQVCRCKADPPQPHGPYIQWTRKVAGKTVTRNLDQRQYQRYKPWFDNARRLRDLLTELEALSLRTAEDAEGWEPKT